MCLTKERELGPAAADLVTVSCGGSQWLPRGSAGAEAGPQALALLVS